MERKTRKDFLISYNNRDDTWAQWIAWILEQEGYQVTIHAWDFMSGGNFVLDMHRAAIECDRTIGVLSSNSMSAPLVLQEWAAALAQDPEGNQQKFVPVRISPCHPEGLLGALTNIDLVGLPENLARETLLSQVKQGRRKPATAQAFPGGVASQGAPVPAGWGADVRRVTRPEYFPGQAVPVFICADNKDLRYVEELRKHLFQLQKRGGISIWHHSDVPPGAPVQAEVDSHFEEAQIILLLVSSNLLGSSENDMLIQRAMNKSGARVLPVLLSPVALPGAPFDGLMSLPRNRVPIVKWPDRDSAWVEVSEQLLRVAQEQTA